MKQHSISKHVGAAITEGWIEGGSFLGSILAGTLIGLALDHWLGTAPWLVVTGVVLGAYSGFARVWQQIKAQPEGVSLTLPAADQELSE